MRPHRNANLHNEPGVKLITDYNYFLQYRSWYWLDEKYIGIKTELNGNVIMFSALQELHHTSLLCPGGSRCVYHYNPVKACLVHTP